MDTTEGFSLLLIHQNGPCSLTHVKDVPFGTVGGPAPSGPLGPQRGQVLQILGVNVLMLLVVFAARWLAVGTQVAVRRQAW